MAIPLKYNTASQEIPLGYFVDSTDGNTEETGLTIANTDIKLWKSGATTLANKNSGGATHISNGIYYCVLDATDTNTYGPLVIFVHVAGALAVRVECVVMEADAYDALYAAAGTGHIEADAVQISGDATAADNLESDYDGTGYAKANSTIGTCTTNTDMITAAAVNGEVVDVLKTDTIAEMAQGAPPATPTFEEAVMYLYMALRNKLDITAALKEFHNDAGAVIWKKALSDDTTTYSEAEGASGP